MPASPKQEKVDHNTDRYPTFSKVISAIQEHDDFPTGPVERIEVNCFASGEATWRIWTPRAEEPAGGYFASP